ncbi:MAG: RNA ligase [Patescibacteria group bacterium]
MIKIDVDELKNLVEHKYINVQRHPTLPINIYNYTQKTQFNEYWNPITLACRGLILDDQFNVVAKPFDKFFNLEQLEASNTLPNSTFKVFEKLDGSLGILFYYQGQWRIATRGSFTSEQAIYANNELLPLYQKEIDQFDIECTYLLEIIYPQNRIVVDYKNQKRLVMLGAINIKTGLEVPLEDIVYSDKCKSYDGLGDYEKIRSILNSEDEGYILLFENGTRAKFKFSEYKRLHRILTNVSSKTVWEYLKDDKEFDDLVERVPDEFYNWLKDTKSTLLNEYKEKERDLQSKFHSLDLTLDRKEIAKEIVAKHKADSRFLFLILDEKDTSKQIWESIKPAFTKPFKNDEN